MFNGTVMRAGRVQGALKRVTAAIRDVESKVAAMKAEQDPLAPHIFSTPSLSEHSGHKKRKAQRINSPVAFQYCLQARLSRQHRRVGTPHASSCEAVNDFGTSIGSTLEHHRMLRL